jgi:hypothetical protein
MAADSLEGCEMKPYTTEEGHRYGFVAALETPNYWEAASSHYLFKRGLTGITNVCTCTRTYRSGFTEMGLMAWVDCKNCDGYGMAPIPWSELK